MKTIELADAATGNVICGSCAVADKPWQRVRGLLGRDGLEVDEGMLFSHTGSVHTYGMKFPIDVVFLDKGLTVLSFHAHVGKSRALKHRGAAWTLELPSGTCHRRGVSAGMHLVRREVRVVATIPFESEPPSGPHAERRSSTSVGTPLRLETRDAPTRRSSGL